MRQKDINLFKANVKSLTKKPRCYEKIDLPFYSDCGNNFM